MLGAGLGDPGSWVGCPWGLGRGCPGGWNGCPQGLGRVSWGLRQVWESLQYRCEYRRVTNRPPQRVSGECVQVSSKQKQARKAEGLCAQLGHTWTFLGGVWGCPAYHRAWEHCGDSFGLDGKILPASS